MSEGNIFGAQNFLQNLQLLSKLQNLINLTNLDLASHLLFNFNLSVAPPDNKIAIGLGVPGASGWVPVGTPASPFYVAQSNSFNTPIKNAVVYTLGGPISNSASPVTILSHTYTPVDTNSLLLIIGASQITNHTPGVATWDLGLYVGSTLYTSSRTYANTDVGSTTLYTNYLNTTGSTITINLKAVLHSGATTLDTSVASFSILEL